MNGDDISHLKDTITWIQAFFQKLVFRKIMEQQQQSLQCVTEERGRDIISLARDIGKNK